MCFCLRGMFPYHTYRSCATLSYLSAISISHCLTGLQHEGIFRVSGSQVEVNDIKNAFERGKEDLLRYLGSYCQMSTLVLNIPKQPGLRAAC